MRPGTADTARAGFADDKLAQARQRLRAIANSSWRLSDGGHLADLERQVRELKEIRSMMNAALYIARDTARAQGLRIVGRP